ncbi:hypothetical protein ACFRAM_26290 [Paenibacillus sp. NPDC056722]|uniref:hypothetical protein n=1 Tax=Paenibacillus sp. NPDC056722 TaxID=3345924 RepID=UPI00367B5015
MKAPEAERDHRLREIVSQEAWIIEGVYRSWVEPSLSAADQIIVLMPPLSVQEARIWNRYEERISGAVFGKQRETLQDVQRLTEWNREYNLKKLPHFIAQSNYRDKIIQVNDNLELIEQYCKRE